MVQKKKELNKNKRILIHFFNLHNLEKYFLHMVFVILCLRNIRENLSFIFGEEQ